MQSGRCKPIRHTEQARVRAGFFVSDTGAFAAPAG